MARKHPRWVDRIIAVADAGGVDVLCYEVGGNGTWYVHCRHAATPDRLFYVIIGNQGAMGSRVTRFAAACQASRQHFDDYPGGRLARANVCTMFEVPKPRAKDPEDTWVACSSRNARLLGDFTKRRTPLRPGEPELPNHDWRRADHIDPDHPEIRQ